MTVTSSQSLLIVHIDLERQETDKDHYVSDSKKRKDFRAGIHDHGVHVKLMGDCEYLAAIVIGVNRTAKDRRFPQYLLRNYEEAL
jgi:hypothetical protein